jgi:phosphotransferase system enzyme I (PtsI)
MILDDSALSQAKQPSGPAPTPSGRWCSRWKSSPTASRDRRRICEAQGRLQQAVERVLKALMGAQTLAEPRSPRSRLIVVAHDLSPADMILFKRHHFAASSPTSAA